MNYFPPWLQMVTPYVPGVTEHARDGNTVEPVHLCSNENPLGPSSMAVAAMREATLNTWRYPDAKMTALADQIAQWQGVEPESLIICNGTSHLLFYLAHAVADRWHNAVYSQYGFVGYSLAVRSAGLHPVEVPVAADFTQNLAAMASAVNDRTRLLFLANPNNPTGTYAEPEEIRRFLRTVPEHVLVVLDEAYWDYVEGPRTESIEALFAVRQNLMVMRTFSKAYGLAGVRIGFAVAGREVVQMFNRVREPFSVNMLALVAAGAAIDDQAHVRAGVDLVLSQRDTLNRRCELLGLEPVRGQGNFLFFRSPIGGRRLNQALAARGFRVRPLMPYGLPDHLRVTIGLPADMDRLTLALEDVLASPTFQATPGGAMAR